MSHALPGYSLHVTALTRQPPGWHYRDSHDYTLIVPRFRQQSVGCLGIHPPRNTPLCFGHEVTLPVLPSITGEG